MAVTLSTAQCTHAEASIAGAALNCTFPGANTAGNTLVCFVGIFRNSTVAASTVSVTDNAGNVWTRISSAETSSRTTAWYTGSMFYAANCAGTTNTVTSSTPQSSSFMSIWVAELGGVGVTSFDVGASTKGNSSRQTHAGVTLSTAGGAMLCGIADGSGASTAYAWSTAAGSTGPMAARTEWSVLNGATFERIGGCSLLAVSSGLAQPTSSFASLATHWVSVTAGFFPGGVAPSVIRPVFTLMGAGR